MSCSKTLEFQAAILYGIQVFSTIILPVCNDTTYWLLPNRTWQFSAFIMSTWIPKHACIAFSFARSQLFALCTLKWSWLKCTDRQISEIIYNQIQNRCSEPSFGYVPKMLQNDTPLARKSRSDTFLLKALQQCTLHFNYWHFEKETGHLNFGHLQPIYLHFVKCFLIQLNLFICILNRSM